MRSLAWILTIFPATAACTSLDLDEATQALGGDAGSGGGGDANTNRPPNAVDDSVVTDMGMPVGVYVLGNDSDPDGDALTVSLTGASDWPFSRTTFDCFSDGNCWIEAYPHESGTGSFGYQACDPGGLCSEATVTVTINHIAVNAYADDDTATTDVDTAADIDVLANDTDNDAGWDYYSLWFPQGPWYGTAVTGGDGWVTYVPEPGYRGTDLFQYEICNRDGRCARAWVTVNVDAGAPLAARDDSVNAYPGYERYYTPSDNDRIPGGQAYAVSILVDPAHGSLFTDGYAVYYNPHYDYLGPDELVYALCLTDGRCAAARMKFNVRGNSEPVIVEDFVHTDEDHPIDFNALTNDYDPDGDPIHLSSPCEPWDWSFRRTTLSCADDGWCHVETSPLDTGTGSVMCRVCDEIFCVEEIVPVQIDRVPNPPEGTDDTASTEEDTPIEINVLWNDAFNGGPPVYDTMTFAGPSHGTAVVDIDTGRVTYTPSDDFHGTDTFVYYICDVFGLCTFATVTMTVTPIADPPEFTPAPTNTYQRISRTGIPVALQAIDPDGVPGLTFAKISGSLPDNITLRTNGTFASTGGHHKGTYTSTIRVTDADGFTATTTLVIVVQ